MDWGKVAETVDKAVARLPIIEQARSRAAGRACGRSRPDDHAIIGRAPGVEGFFLAVGFGGHGFQHSPTTGRLVAEWILDGNPSMDLFRWRIPPGSATTRAFPATDTRTSPMPSEPAVKIVVPDDFPPALTGSVAEAPLKKMGQVRVFTERGADQESTLIERIGDAEVVVNIRAHARFTDRVLAACPKLRLISIWGAGTDNVDLAACKARGVAVTNTPGVNATLSPSTPSPSCWR